MNVKVKENLVQVLYEQVGVEIKNQDYIQALSTLQTLLELWGDFADHELYGGVQGYYAMIYKYQGKYTPALKAAQEALEYYQKQEDYQQIFRYRQFLGEFYCHFCKYDEAIEEWEQAIAIAEYIPRQRVKLAGKGEVHLKLGELLLTLSLFGMARTNFDKGLAYGRTLRDHRLIRQCQKGMGVTYHLENRFELALPFYYGTLRKARKADDQALVGQVLHSLGDIFTKTGQMEKSLKIYAKSYEISEENDDFLTSAATLRELGRIYLKLEPEKTLSYCERALDKLIENITSETRGDCERLMGKIFYLTAMYYYKEQNLKQAMDNLVEAGEIFHRFGMQKEVVRSQRMYQAIAGRPVRPAMYATPQSLLAKLGIT